MSEVSIRELRNHGGEIVDRVASGETVTITRSGKPVAEMGPVVGPPLPAAVLLAHWRHLPSLDPDRLRRDIDAVVDARL
jgi:antitoxin (DNA-binding transcriptional repressor) of toxin-antitoxin stability system